MRWVYTAVWTATFGYVAALVVVDLVLVVIGDGLTGRILLRWVLVSTLSIASTGVLLHVIMRAVARGRRDVLLLQERVHEAERGVDALLAAVSHDLQNPLAAIRNQARTARHRAARGDGLDRVQASLDAIEASAEHAIAQLTELVDLSRMTAGRTVPLERGPVDLVSLVNRAVASLGFAHEDARVEVCCSAPELVGSWDAVRLRRVVDNLLSNAYKYSPSGAPISVSLQRCDAPHGPIAALRVEDRGLGIPEADLPRVFDPYFRGANIATFARGSGLGLTGARQVVEQHGGTIEAENREGAGSVFTVRLPL